VIIVSPQLVKLVTGHKATVAWLTITDLPDFVCPVTTQRTAVELLGIGGLPSCAGSPALKPIHRHRIANVLALESLQIGLSPRPRNGEETLCTNRFDAIVLVAMRERVEFRNIQR